MADRSGLIADRCKVKDNGSKACNGYHTMSFAFEELKVYQRAIAFGTSVIDAVEQMCTPTMHDRLVEQLEASSASAALNIA